MRHLVGFLSGLILGLVLVLSCGWVWSHLRGLHSLGLDALSGSGPVALAVLAAVGLVVAMAAVPPRLTPLLPFGAALVLGGISAVALVRPAWLDRLPDLPGMAGALVLLPLGAFVPLVIVLTAPVLVGGRWRRWDHDGESVTPDEYFEGLYDDDDEEPRRAAGRGAQAQARVSSSTGGRHAMSRRDE
ncbi:hypothetical protein KIK06_07050 [Nocardiopsis sp. EMB25]|uniref:hypothetical protein n=1 Tax=Nocardiopsis sp. EMB25 TaxID=2835867 RepID=UPI002283E058|nr:hypothetical protein [Nocardiopsis sp. EMB25]MCY9783648.1 hypothetical protein [Nocardiopsis sp. EMB25]